MQLTRIQGWNAVDEDRHDAAFSRCSLLAILGCCPLRAQAQTPTGFELQSGGLEARVVATTGHLQGFDFRTAGTHEVLPLQEPFRIRMQDRREVATSTLALVTPPTMETIAP